MVANREAREWPPSRILVNAKHGGNSKVKEIYETEGP